jgi:hypothetical protein
MWGNPWQVDFHGTREEVVRYYREWLDGERPAPLHWPVSPVSLRAALPNYAVRSDVLVPSRRAMSWRCAARYREPMKAPRSVYNTAPLARMKTFAASILAVMLGIVASLATALYFSYEVPVVFKYISVVILVVGAVIVWMLSDEM